MTLPDQRRTGAVRAAAAMLTGNRLDKTGLFLLIAAGYTARYLSHEALPGNTIDFPLGWWGWWDTGLYLKSARALAAFDLSPAAHWYPMGYALLGALFVPFVPNHIFYFPDLLLLVGAALLFVEIAQVFGIRAVPAVLIFLFSILSDPLIFEQFVVPWNTTPVVAYVYLALYVTIRPGSLRLSSAVIAAVAAALVLVTRPSDSVVIAPIGAALVWRSFAELPPLRAGLWLGAGTVAGLAILSAYLALHASIFGLALSPYMVQSGTMGLEPRYFFQKLYSVLLDPLPVFGEGQGLAQRSPWLILSFVGLVVGLRRGWRFALVAAVVAANVCFYTAYADFLPHGIWRYYNIHYLKLSYPLMGLSAAVLIVECYRSRAVLAAAVAGVALILSVRLETVRSTAVAVTVADAMTLQFDCRTCGPERVLVVDPALLDYSFVYYYDHVATIGAKTLHNIYDFRTIPVVGTIRVVLPIALEGRALRIAFQVPHRYTQATLPKAEALDNRFRLTWPRLP